MQVLFRGLLMAAVIMFVAGLNGCGGGGDEVLDYDPEVSEQKAAEYEEQMKEAMQNQGRR